MTTISISTFVLSFDSKNRYVQYGAEEDVKFIFTKWNKFLCRKGNLNDPNNKGEQRKKSSEFSSELCSIVEFSELVTMEI